MEWSLKDFSKDEILEPIDYKHKTQADLVNEVCEALESKDIVFLHGAVGTGKSVVALHTIAEYGKGSINTQTKALENQYVRDYYQGNIGIELSNGEPLMIESIRGKNNFECPYFEKRRRCNYRGLPCNRPLRRDEKRNQVASECPYWCPIRPDEAVESLVKRLKKRGEDPTTAEYESVSGKTNVFVGRKHNCPFYGQYKAYTKDNIAVVMNSALWNIETLFGRKAKFPVEFIDEGDAYLDSLCFRISISSQSLERILEKNKDIDEDAANELLNLFSETTNQYKGYRGKAEELSELIDSLKELSLITGELNNIQVIDKYIAQAFAEVRYGEQKRDKRITFYIAEPSFVLDKIRKRSGKLVLMSATFQKKSVLENFYNIRPEEYATAFGQTRFPGTVYLMKTSHELKVNFKNWKSENFRNSYFKLRDRQIEIASPPVLGLPWGKKYMEGLDVNDQNLRNMEILENGDEDWSTVANRGIDLKDDKCRSLILLKCPFPDTSDPVLQTMKLKYGDNKFKEYYFDISNRNLLQMVGRGVRNPKDWVEVWSPDLNVHTNLIHNWNGNLIVKAPSKR